MSRLRVLAGYFLSGLGQAERAQHLNLGGPQQGNALQSLLQSQQLTQLRSQQGTPTGGYSGIPGFAYSQVCLSCFPAI